MAGDSDDDWENQLEEDNKESWEDEVDEVGKDLQSKVQVRQQTPAEIAAAAQKAQEEARRLAQRVEFQRQAEETDDERRLRERAQQEQAEVGLISDLLDAGSAAQRPAGNASVGGLESVIATLPLQTKKDHEQFARTVAERLRDSTGLQVHAFARELFPRLLERLSAENMRDLSALVESYSKASAAAAAPAAKPKNTKQKKQQAKRHEDTFGGDYEYSSGAQSDRYLGMEDDFM